jgi:SAM-dependent methyltransferase
MLLSDKKVLSIARDKATVPESTNGLKRGMKGSMPTMPRRSDEAYLDFISGARQELMHAHWGNLLALGYSALAAAKDESGQIPNSVDEVKRVLLDFPEMAAFMRIKRTLQESCWNRVIDAYALEQDEFIKALDESDGQPPGSVKWDPNFQYPEYATVDIHIQPGGYTQHPLSGLIYDHGTKVFFGGSAPVDFIHEATAKGIATPSDGTVQRILEIGCSVGQLICALKNLFPEAEACGIDISAPMVRYAHWRAKQRNIDVHFEQMAAERLSFPDNHCDLVAAHILFHELPVEVIRKTVGEVFRVLRPGGTFVLWDFPTATAQNPSYANFMGILDAADNGEPYALGFVRCGVEELMKQAGFTLRSEQPEIIMAQGRVGDKPT